MPFGFFPYLDDGIATPLSFRLSSSFRLLLLPVFRQFSLHFCARFDYFIAHPPGPPFTHAPVQTSFEIKTFWAAGARWGTAKSHS